MNNGIKKRITTTSRRRTTRGEERKERKETSGLKEEKHELNKGELNGQQKTYKELLRSQSLLGFGALADAIRLFPEMLKLTKEGFFVKRA